MSETDVYEGLGLHFSYDTADRLNFVEVIRSASPTIEFNGIVLFSKPYPTVVQDMVALGYPAIQESDGCYFQALGISIFSPGKTQIDSVGVFETEEFEKYLKLKREIADKRRKREQRRSRGC